MASDPDMSGAPDAPMENVAENIAWIADTVKRVARDALRESRQAKARAVAIGKAWKKGDAKKLLSLNALSRVQADYLDHYIKSLRAERRRR